MVTFLSWGPSRSSSFASCTQWATMLYKSLRAWCSSHQQLSPCGTFSYQRAVVQTLTSCRDDYPYLPRAKSLFWMRSYRLGGTCSDICSSVLAKVTRVGSCPSGWASYQVWGLIHKGCKGAWFIWCSLVACLRLKVRCSALPLVWKFLGISGLSLGGSYVSGNGFLRTVPDLGSMGFLCKTKGRSILSCNAFSEAFDLAWVTVTVAAEGTESH